MRVVKGEIESRWWGVLRGGLFAGLIKGCGLRCGVGLKSGKDIGEKGGRLWKMRRGSGWPC